MWTTKVDVGDFYLDVCDIVLKDLGKNFFTFVFSSLQTYVIVYASAFYGKVEVTSLNYVTGLHLSPQATQSFHFIRV